MNAVLVAPAKMIPELYPFVARAYCEVKFVRISETKLGELRSCNSTDMICAPLNFLTSTEIYSDSKLTFGVAAFSAETATEGSTVIFGISNVSPASGNVPELML